MVMSSIINRPDRGQTAALPQSEADPGPTGDPTYINLGYIRDKDNKKPGLVVFTNQIGVESGTDRGYWMDDTSLAANQAQYLYGRPDGKRTDLTPTLNLTQNAINTYLANALRIPPTTKLLSASVNEDGVWVLIKPYTIHAKNPGEQDVPLQVGQVLEDEVVDMVPTAKRVCIDTDTVVAFYQSIFDIKRRESNLDQTIRDMILQKSIQGWDMGLFQWDPQNHLPVWESFPLQQWFPDEMRADVAKMSFVRLDWPIDSLLAQRRWPQIADKVREFASKSLVYNQGSFGYSNLYQGQVLARPIVTVSLCWLRNWEEPMTLDEAVESGLVIVVEDTINATIEAEAAPEGTEPPETTTDAETPEGFPGAQHNQTRTGEVPTDDDAGKGSGFGRLTEANQAGVNEKEPAQASNQPKPAPDVQTTISSGAGQVAQSDAGTSQMAVTGGEGTMGSGLEGLADAAGTAPAPAPVSRRVVHAITGEDLSACFDDDGNAIKGYVYNGLKIIHPNHPMRICIRQWMLIRNEIVDDRICPFWDMPVWLDKNVPILNRPWAQSECERIRTIQNSLNSNHQVMVDHAQMFRAQMGAIARDLLNKTDPDIVNGFAQPGKMFTVDTAGVQDFDIRRMIMVVPPPEMGPAVPLMMNKLNADFDKVSGNTMVMQGDAPPDVTSGRAIAALQSQNQATQDVKSKYTETAVHRQGMLMIHAIVNYMDAKAIRQVNRKYSEELLEQHIIPFARSMKWDLDVELATGSGMVKAQNDAQVRQDIVNGILDKRTGREKLGYNPDEIERREKEAREELAREAAEAQAGQESTAPKFNLSIAFKDMPLAAQDGVLRMLGLPEGAQIQAQQMGMGQQLTLPGEEQPPAEAPDAAQAEM